MASTTGATSGSNLITIPELREFRRHLRTLEDSRTWTKRLAQVNRDLAKDAAAWSQAEARAMGGAQRRFAKRIVGRGTVSGARIQIQHKEANAAFWGAKKRTGWNARNTNSRPQLPEWVGAGWDVAVRGQGPYAINEALASHMPEIIEAYEEAVTDLAADAGFH